MDDRLPLRAPAASSDEQLCTALCAYLAENPRAMDTLEGIASWWVARQQIRADVLRVSRALALLERRGIVERIDGSGTACFRLKASSAAQLAAQPEAAEPNIGQSRG